MRRKKNQEIINYLFTVGFIILILIFLGSMVVISKVVFSNYSPIGQHVLETKNLLEDISEVKRVVKEGIQVEKYENKKISEFTQNFNLTDISYNNIEENKTVMVFFLDREIGSVNKEIYYYKIQNINQIKKNDLIVYNENKTGIYVEEIDGDIEIYNFIEKKFEKINLNNILGIVFLNIKDE